MLKINVTGNAGAGKSTFANKLGEITGIQVYGLDAIVWKPGWVKNDEEGIKVEIDKITANKSWVIEGVSRQVWNQSDMIIFLDFPTTVCMWRCFKRNIRYLFRSRPDLPENCPEILILPELLRIILQFSKRVRPIILGYEKKKNVGPTFIRVRTQHEANELLNFFRQKDFGHQKFSTISSLVQNYQRRLS